MAATHRNLESPELSLGGLICKVGYRRLECPGVEFIEDFRPNHRNRFFLREPRERPELHRPDIFPTADEGSIACYHPVKCLKSKTH